jgi:hypothetical protein
MSELETPPLISADAELRLDSWAESLIERHGRDQLSLIPYDPSNPYHSPDFLKAEPDNPNLADAAHRGRQAVGPANFGPFFGDIKRLPDQGGHSYGAMRHLKSWLRSRNHNVALVTNHADLMDLPLAQTALFRALEDDAIGSQSSIIVSRTMTRLAYQGVPVVDMLRKNGSVYFTMPRTSSAEKYGIQEDESVNFNRRMGKQLANDLRQLKIQGKSMLLAVSLSGKTLDRSDGSVTMPDYEPTTAKLILNRFNCVLPMSIYLDNLTQNKDWYRLHPPQVLGSQKDMDQLMELLALDTVDLSGENVRYAGRQYLGKIALKN